MRKKVTLVFLSPFILALAAMRSLFEHDSSAPSIYQQRRLGA